VFSATRGEGIVELLRKFFFLTRTRATSPPPNSAASTHPVASLRGSPRGTPTSRRPYGRGAASAQGVVECRCVGGLEGGGCSCLLPRLHPRGRARPVRVVPCDSRTSRTSASSSCALEQLSFFNTNHIYYIKAAQIHQGPYGKGQIQKDR
jgi:hypothetical protein